MRGRDSGLLKQGGIDRAAGYTVISTAHIRHYSGF